MKRYLTKSRFKIALDCPRKLYYTNKSLYENTNDEDSFLMALADGGFQVGALAKCYYPNGHYIIESGYELPIKRTNELLKQKNVTIYEAAIRYENLFIRIDILEKKGNNIKLIEVKAKSVYGDDESIFIDNDGYITGGWDGYLYDVAFQKYVLEKSFPEYTIDSYLMLTDKSKVATVNGLNQKFQLINNADGQKSVKLLGDTSLKALGEPILSAIKINNIIEKIFSGTSTPNPPEMSFEKMIQQYADAYKKDEKLYADIGIHCAGCEFNTSAIGKKSGFKECWREQTSLTDTDFNRPMIFEIGNYFRGKQNCFNEGIYFIEDIQKEHIGDISPKYDGTLSSKERQWLQIQKIKENDNTAYIDYVGLKNAMNNHNYPLHFIDFETSMVAIPFYKGSKPYEQIAFQYSHHIMEKNGEIRHASQFISTKKGKFPNFDFLRALKKDLEKDNGTIFRYHNHENTVLNQIATQLKESEKPEKDKDELLTFIESITHNEEHTGERDMVDLFRMVVNYYYHPIMGGSNSIKVVLPAVINDSKFIQEKYSKPIYGKNSNIKSLNFDDGWSWVKFNTDGSVKDPYKLLPNLFEDISVEDANSFIADKHLADGGAALTAFAKMQFTEMSETEYNHIIAGLLRYCELDTMAMVIIYEYWLNEVKNKAN